MYDTNRFKLIKKNKIKEIKQLLTLMVLTVLRDFYLTMNYSL